MIKTIFIITLFINFAFASNNLMSELRTNFYQNVNEVNIYKKRFGTYIDKKCQYNVQCELTLIKRLKTWKTVSDDVSFIRMLKIYNERLKINKIYWQHLITKLNDKKLKLYKTQFVSIIDLNKQLYIIVLWSKFTQKYYFIGDDLISSGNIYRECEVKFGEDHYLKTPSGVFKANQGWRSNGKYSDDNVTLGYGRKDRFIYYFGKQQSVRYNTFDSNKDKIKDETKWKLITDTLHFAMHSHKSSKAMGKPESHGCIRMSDELNIFLDTNSVLYKNMFKKNKWVFKYSTQPLNSKYQEYAGEYLIVFDNI